MNNRFIWISISDAIIPVQSLKDFILKATGLEPEITESTCDTDAVVRAKNEGCGIIIPATRSDLLRPFIEAAKENQVELLFPEFNNCDEADAEITVDAPCGTHYLKFAGFKRPVIDDNGICFLDL